MKDRNKGRWILWYEALGFASLITLSWLDELLGLPHRLFGGGTHANWREAMLESFFIVLVGVAVMVFTRRLLQRLHYLEGFLRVCAWCRQICHDDKWMRVEDYFDASFNIKSTHGMCPSCKQRYDLEMVAEENRAEYWRDVPQP